MNYIVGYAASAFEKNIYDSINYAKENGFKAVELNVNMPIFFPENFSLEEREKIKNYAKEHNIIITLHGPEDITFLQLQDGINIASINRIKDVIDFANDIEAKFLTLHIGASVCFTLTDKKIYIDEMFYEKYKKRLEENLLEIINYSKDKVKICIENSGRFPEVLVQETLSEFIKKYDLYLTWDIGHSYKNVYNEVDFFIKNKNKIRVSHVHDNNGKSDHQILGEGNIDIKKHFEIIGENVIYILEVRPRENATTSLKKLEKILK
ncbi:sugar phosphate isomerase/epimerase [Hypnocyclicus thermotrophus]|uniref:Sugar phosphate isomerase/epimerase n=1 Tax=Hypnocyclicus thermotrophus TaxID=1627895 RepID=A0AA46I6V0_9FUSO|nr:sugar phosphate isomerase/epimerase family protein [Hypnocyclicus thermotrophus]TDT72248.1 sugar phosphate isomerase/epimerase [Hypnocyclicus thermotrophus]